MNGATIPGVISFVCDISFCGVLYCEFIFQTKKDEFTIKIKTIALIHIFSISLLLKCIVM